MSGLLDAVMLGAILTIPAAALAWLVAVRLQSQAPGASIALWRAARWAAVTPLLLAPVIFAAPAPAPAHPSALPVLLADPFTSAEKQVLAAPATTTKAVASTPVRATLAVLYLSGLAIALLLSLRRRLWRRRLITESRPAGPGERSRLELHAQALGIAAPEMRVAERAISPLLTGWRGVIVVPEAILTDPRREAFAIVHELVHLRRGDERDRLVGSALAALLWFNIPLRWIERRLDVARELACDTETLEALGGAERKAYAEALIDVMRGPAQPASAFGSRKRKDRVMRIKAILSGAPPRARRGAAYAAAVLAAVTPVGAAQALLTDRAEASLFAEAAPSAVVGPAASVSPVAGPAPALAAPPTPVTFTHPVAEGWVSSRYGARPARPGGAPFMHHGIDIAARAGAPVHAPADGVVTHARFGFSGSDRWGNTIAVDHGGGWVTVYAHLDRIDVEVGDAVAAGDLLGGVGSTGQATGPHVHIEVRVNGERVNPADHLPDLH